MSISRLLCGINKTISLSVKFMFLAIFIIFQLFLIQLFLYKDSLNNNHINVAKAAVVDNLIGPGILSDQYGVTNTSWSYNISSRLLNSGTGITITTDDPTHITVSGAILTFNYSAATVNPTQAGVEGKAVVITATNAQGDTQTNTIYVRVVDGKGTVSGRVADANNNSISGAVVSDSSTSRTATTDAGGNYTLTNMPEGEYALFASRSGYVMQTRYVSVGNNTTSSLNFSLQAVVAPSINYNAGNKIITIVSGVATTADIATAVNNAAVFSRSGNNSTLTANIFISPGAWLIISNDYITVNSNATDAFTIGGGGNLRMINSRLKTANPAYRAFVNMYVPDFAPYQWSGNLINTEIDGFGSETATDWFGNTGIPAVTLGHLMSDNYNRPNSPIIVQNCFIRNAQFAMLDARIYETAYVSNYKIVGNRFDNLTYNHVGNGGIITFDFSYGLFKNNIISNIQTGVIIVWISGFSNTQFVHNEMHDCSGQLMETKHSDNMTISYNHFNNCQGSIYVYKGTSAQNPNAYAYGDMIIGNFIENHATDSAALSIQYYSQTPNIVKDNVVRNVSKLWNSGGTGIAFLGANETVFENNTVENCAGPGIGLTSAIYRDNEVEHIENVHFKNNTVRSCNRGVVFTNFYIAQDPLYPSFVIDSISVNEVYENNGADIYPQGMLYDSKNINIKANITLSNATAFYNYKYLDVRIVDQSGNPIQNATVTVTNTTNASYPSIDIDGNDQSAFVTGANGYTPLPSDSGNSIAVLDFIQTSSATTQMAYTITATKDGHAATITGVNPADGWYRAAPDTHSNTVVLALDTAGTVDTTPPVTSVSATSGGSAYAFNTWTHSSPVNVTLTCADADTGCGSTKYCTDTANTCNPSTGTTYTVPFNINTSGVSYIRYLSTDSSGNPETVKSQTVRIDTANPAVSAGADQTRSVLFTQTATASDALSGIDSSSYAWSKVSGPGTITFGTPNALSSTISASMDGTYAIGFTAEDMAGNAIQDTFTLVWDAASPTILSIITSLESGTYGINAVLPLTVNFSEPVTSAGSVTLTLNSTPSRSCAFTLSNSSQGICSYTVQSGDAATNLNLTLSGNITDAGGNALTNFIPAANLYPAKTININTINKVVTPIISPNGGTYSSSRQVTISTTTSGSTIYYTIDGSDPTAASSTYTGALNIASSATVKAVGIRAGYANSDVASAAYTISIAVGGGGGGGGGGGSTPASPTVSKLQILSRKGDILNLSLSVANSKDMMIAETSDFKSSNWETYSSSKAYSIKTASLKLYLKFRSTSGLTSSVSTLDIPAKSTATAPAFSLASGTYSASQTLSMTADPTSVIHYTIDGTNPTSSSSLYSAPLAIAKTTIVKAIAIQTDYLDSTVTSATYTISVTSPPSSTGSLIKTASSFRVYVMINGKKKWVSTPEVFEQLGYKWTDIKVMSDTELKAIPDYEDNLIRQAGDYKVFLVVNGVRRHIPNPEIFLDYGFLWGDVVDTPKETIDKYKPTYLIKQSGNDGIYYITPGEVRKLIPTTEIFNSYNDKMEDVQIVSKKEMESYPLSNLIKLPGSNDIYLIEGNVKKRIPNAGVFNKYHLNWSLVTSVNEYEFNWYKDGGALG